MEEFRIQIEGIREAVGRINAHDKRAVVKLGKLYASSSCDGVLP